ncbi:uncharacterized protein AMSG_03310 [Thecamonas trahens ATCC 50062]|uniref:FERM domain-containing protein n=1 Tax=Thecamonas trahens ATCC 50062 TaxID=461836 RepID=A0A0L0D3K3_THETB|nr:hypothetical protein AMSG_03310 [Thecamonas trahens ATCC 50062]KNC46879.1 hypothetical protein AMSG_03310 [Thecamonas trahens ATCC 50062]|eukprot:XP_013760152.1 hypothetical protein AMSG_03310 [Thecamonas trahens ATCC 50062]
MLAPVRAPQSRIAGSGNVRTVGYNGELAQKQFELEGHVTFTDMDLRVELYKRNPLGVEELVLGRVVRGVNPAMTVRELCHRVNDELNHGSADSTPEQGWGLFIPWDAQASLINTGAAPSSSLVDVEFKSQYLELHHDLHRYNLTGGMRLHYKQRRRTIRVLVFDAVKRVLIDEAWNVQKISEAVATAAGVRNVAEYSLKLRDDPEEPEAGWLNVNLTLHEQKVRLDPWEANNETHVPDPLIFKQKLFFPDGARGHVDEDLADPLQARLLYRQYRQMVSTRQMPVSEDEAVALAACILQIEEGDYTKSKEAHAALDGALATIVPPPHTEAKKIDDAVVKAYKALRGMSGVAAVRKYVELVRGSPTFGWAFFEMRERIVAGRRARNIPRLLAVGGKGIARVEPKAMRFLISNPWADLTEAYGAQVDSLPGLRIEFASEPLAPFQCVLGKQDEQYVHDLLRLIREYFAYFAAHVVVDTGEEMAPPVWDEVRRPTAASLIYPARPKGKQREPERKLVNMVISASDAPPASPAQVKSAMPGIVAAASAALPSTADAPLPQRAAAVDADFEDDDAREARLLAVADSNDALVDVTAAVNIGLANLVLAAGGGEPSLVDSSLLLAAAQSVADALGEMRGTVDKGAELASDPIDAAALGNAYNTVSSGALTMLGAAGAVLGPSGTIDTLALDSLLGAASNVSGALAAMLGAAGVGAPASRAGDSLLELTARMANVEAPAFAVSMDGKHFSELPVVTTHKLHAQAASLPKATARFYAQLQLLLPSIKVDAAAASLLAQARMMATMVESATVAVPIDENEPYAAGSTLRTTMQAVLAGLEALVTVPIVDDAVAEAASAIDASLSKILEHADEPATVRALVNGVGMRVASLCELASLEAGAFGMGGSYDSLLAASQDVADALAKLKGASRALSATDGSDEARESLECAVAGVQDARGAFVAERTQLEVMREVVALVENVQDKLAVTVARLTPVSASMEEGRAKEKSSRALADAQRTTDSLHRAMRVYAAAPAELASQDKFLQAARKAVDKSHRLATAAKTSEDEGAEAAGGALAESVDALEAGTQKASVVCWPIDLNYALELIRGALRRLAAESAAAAEGKLVRGSDVDDRDASALQRQDALVASVSAVPPVGEALVESALTKTAPEMSQVAKDVAAEIVHASDSASALAQVVEAAEDQHTLLEAAVAVCHEGAALISKAREARRRPNDATQEFILMHGNELLREALHKLELAMPGAGDCASGVEAMAAALEKINAEAVPSGLDDLLAVTQMLAGAMEVLSSGSSGAVPDAMLSGVPDSSDLVAHGDPTHGFKNDVVSAGRALCSAMGKLETAAASSPRDLALVARRVTSIGQLLTEVVTGAAASDEFKAAKADLLVPLEAVIEAVSSGLAAAGELAKSTEPNPRASGVLQSSEVPAAVKTLNKAIDSVVNPSKSTQAKEFKAAVSAILKALPGLEPAHLPPASQYPIHGLQEDLLHAADLLSLSLHKLSDVAATRPNSASKQAKATATLAARLVGKAAVAGATVQASGRSVQTNEAGRAGSKVETSESRKASNTTAYDELQDELKAVMKALASLLRAKPSSKKKFKGAYTKVVLAVRDLLVAAKEVYKSLADAEADKDALKSLGSKIKSAATKLAKAADANASAPDDSSVHKKFLSAAKSFASALKTYESATKSAALGAGLLGGGSLAGPSGAPGGDGGSLVDELLGGAAAVGNAVNTLIAASKLVSSDVTSAKAQSKMDKKLKSALEALGVLQQHARLITPGQKECADGAEAAVRVAQELGKAALEVGVSRPKAGAGRQYGTKAAALSGALSGVEAGLQALGEAAVSSADALVRAAAELAAALGNLPGKLRGAAEAAAQPALGARILRSGAGVAEAAMVLFESASEAGGDPKHAGRIRPVVAHALEAVRAVTAVVKAEEAAGEAGRAAEAQVEAALARLREGAAAPEAAAASLVDGLKYGDYQKAVKTRLLELVRGASEVMDAAQTAPETVTSAVLVVTEALPGVVAAVLGCMALTGEDEARQALLAAGEAMAAAIAQLATGASSVLMGSPTGLSAVSSGSQQLSEALTQVLGAAARGATGKRMLEGAVSAMSQTLGELETIKFLVGAQELPNEANAEFGELVGSLRSAASELVELVESSVGAEGSIELSAEERGAFAMEAAEAAAKVVELAELGAAALDEAVDQMALLNAAGNLACALKSLVVESGGLSGLQSAAAAFGGAVDAAAAADKRVQATIDQVCDKVMASAAAAEALQKSGKGGTGTGSSPSRAEVSAVESAAKGVLLFSQRLLFAAGRGKHAFLELAEEVPAALETLVKALSRALGGGERMGVPGADAVAEGGANLGPCLVEQLQAFGLSGDVMSEAAKGVSTGVTTVLTGLGRLKSVEAGLDPLVAFEHEMAQVTADINAMKSSLAELAQLAASVAGAKADAAHDAFVALVIKASQEIVSAGVVLVEVAIAAHKGAQAADHEDMVLAARAVAAATGELVAAARFFIQGEARVEALERAASSVADAIHELVEVVSGGAETEAFKRLRGAAAGVESSCKSLAAAATSFAKPAVRPTAASGAGGPGAVGSGATADSIKEMIRRRAEMEKLQRNLAKLKAP